MTKITNEDPENAALTLDSQLKDVFDGLRDDIKLLNKIREEYLADEKDTDDE